MNEITMQIGNIERIKEANGRLAKCLMYTGENSPPVVLLNGAFWNVGYFQTGIDPRTDDLDWELLTPFVLKARAYAEQLQNVRLQSNISSSFYPFLLNLPDNHMDETAKIKHALGLNVSDEFVDIVGDISIEQMADARSLFWEKDMDGEIEEYLSQEEIDTYLHVTALMKAELFSLKMIRFPWEYNRYPVFFVGHAAPDFLVGVAAFRLDR